MKIANNLRCWAVVFWGLLVVSEPLWALDTYKEYQPEHWDIEVGGDYFYSEANYLSSGGGAKSLNSGNHFSLLTMTTAARYVPQDNWSIFGWGSVANSESKDALSIRQNSSFTEIGVGTDFMMYDGGIQLVPEFSAVTPLASIDPLSDSVMNHEGVFELRSRVNLQKNLGAFRGYAWAGFNYRGEGRSFLAPWGFGAQFRTTRLRWGAELFGFQSITEDTNKTSLQRTNYINNVNAGSLRFYSVEPSLIDSRVYMTWLMSSRWSLHLNAGTTLEGANSAAGFHVGGWVRYSFDTPHFKIEEPYVEPISSPVPTSPSQMYQESPLSSEKKVKKFEGQVDDGVDQKLFRPRPTKKPRVDDDALQKQLDETEFNVELKAKKKKRSRR